MSSRQRYATEKGASPSRQKSKNARKGSEESRGKRIQGKRLREEGNDGEDVWKPIFSSANVFVNKRKRATVRMIKAASANDGTEVAV